MANNEGKLEAVPAASADAVALTIVRLTDREAVLPMICSSANSTANASVAKCEPV